MRTFFHLFVYGTLRGEGAAAGLLAGCERVGPATVAGTLYAVEDGYPALVLAGSGRVEGELWRCPAGLLPELDRYEGVEEGLFRRVGHDLDGQGCWTYVAGPKLAARLTPDRRLGSGRW